LCCGQGLPVQTVPFSLQTIPLPLLSENFQILLIQICSVVYGNDMDSLVRSGKNDNSRHMKSRKKM
jgi:hypothetical protein